MNIANYELGISIYLMVIFATIGLFPTCVLGIWAACGITIYNCISVTTSVILLCIDKWGKCARQETRGVRVAEKESAWAARAG